MNIIAIIISLVLTYFATGSFFALLYGITLKLAFRYMPDYMNKVIEEEFYDEFGNYKYAKELSSIKMYGLYCTKENLPRMIIRSMMLDFFLKWPWVILRRYGGTKK